MAKPKSRNGSVVELSADGDPTDIDKKGLSADQFHTLMGIVKRFKQDFHAKGLGFGVQGDIGSRSLKVVTQALTSSPEVKALQESIDSYVKGILGKGTKEKPTPGAMVRGADVVVEARRMAMQSQVAASLAAGTKTASDMRYDKHTKNLHSVYERGDPLAKVLGQREYWSNKKEADNKALLDEKILSLQPGTKQFRKRIHGNWDKKVAEYEAKVEWAKKKENRNNPLAKAIRKAERNKTAGGRFLNRAQSLAKASVIGMVLGAISAAVGTAVKFLSSLPEIAGTVNKIANKSTLLNLPKELIQDYRTLSKAVLGNESTGIVQGFHTELHSKAKSVVSGDISGFLGKLAPMLTLGGGSAIFASTSYFANPNGDNVDKLGRAVINDTVRASFMRKTLQGMAKSEHSAFSTNIADVEGEGREWITALFTRWEQIGDIIKREAIQNAVIKGGDFTALMMDYLKNPSALDVASPLTHGRAEEVGNTARGVMAGISSVLEGILLKILAAVEPLVEIIRYGFFSILEGLNKSVLFKGQFNEVLYEHYQANIQKNIEAKEINERQMKLAEQKVDSLSKKLGITNSDDLDKFYERFANKKGTSGLSTEDAVELATAMHFLKSTRDKTAELKGDKARSGRVRVPGITPIGYAQEAYSFAVGKMDEYLDITANAVLREDLSDTNVLLRKRETLLRQAEELENSPWGHVDYGILARADKLTGEKYWNSDAKAEGYRRYADALEKLISMNADERKQLTDSMNKDTLKYEGSVKAREFSEKQAMQSQFVENVAAGNVNYASLEAAKNAAMQNIIQSVNEGKIRVEVNINKDEKNYTFRLVDSRTGDLLGTIKELSKPTKEFYSDNLFPFDISAVVEAF
jgi:hypothetical protein